MTPKQEAALRLAQRITDYLAGGGLYNPELADHGAVRDLLIDCREALAEQPAQPCGYPYCGCNSKAWCKVEQQSGIKQVIELYDSPEQPAQQEPSFWMDTLDVERKTPTVISNFEKHEGASEAEKCVYPVWTSPSAQQQEPVAKVCHDLDGNIGWNPKLTQLPDEGTSLYTSPQPAQHQEPVAYIRKDQLQKAAQSPMLCEVTPEPRQDRIGIFTSPQSKPWVGLTEEEMKAVHRNAGVTYLVPADYDRHLFTHMTDVQLMKISSAIEAKLREKNT